MHGGGVHACTELRARGVAGVHTRVRGWLRAQGLRAQGLHAQGLCAQRSCAPDNSVPVVELHTSLSRRQVAHALKPCHQLRRWRPSIERLSLSAFHKVGALPILKMNAQRMYRRRTRVHGKIERAPAALG